MGDHNAHSPDFDDSLQGLRYSETKLLNPPIRITRSTSSLHHEFKHPQAHRDTVFASANKKYIQDGDRPHIHATGPDSISARENQTSTTLSLNTRTPTGSSLTSATVGIPQIRLNETAARTSHADRSSDYSAGKDRKWLSLKPLRSTSPASRKEPGANTLDTLPSLGLDINIPTGGFGEELLPTSSIEFSKRGSMLIDGRRANQTSRKNSPTLSAIMDNEKTNGASAPPRTPPATSGSITTAAPRTPSGRPPAKVLSADEEMLSEKVRAFYAAGTDDQHESETTTNLATRMGQRWQSTLGVDARSISVPSLSRATSTTDVNDETNSSRLASMTTSASQPQIILERDEHELAGGLEDWKDISNAEVDRYGFIIAKAPSMDGTDDSRPQKLTRVSTSLQIASETPRRKGTLRRTPSSAQGSVRSLQSKTGGTPDKTPPRPTSSQSAYAGTPRRRASSRIPVPGSKNRRLMDSAMDMLTLPNSAESVVEDGHIHISNIRAKRKELEREEKWRRMARIKPQAKDPKTGQPVVGGGSESEYTFDTSSPKLIERTWKGIPDKWRATAWHSFLSTSASKRKDQLSDPELIELYHTYQDQSSPDDVQIDLDVPRTISSHIMFRRRYRGGQRLLFRVLHAMSLHVPATGYVQGMAALAVTLLAYYSEEKAFVMLVRMWELRGLGKLYASGFGGLMSALDDFEKSWLGQGEVAKKLEALNIGPTAYGTRWYLTLFNYAIPFPAQLRVWDVYMLLDDYTPSSAPSSVSNGISHPPSSRDTTKDIPSGPEDVSFGTTLDVLHAASAALIDGMRDILLESDFENGMKVLTSWIPIQDEDLFMRIARAEWKVHCAKGRSGR